MNRRQPIGADLLRVAVRAKGLLEPQAWARIGAFVSSAAAAGGGFRGRSGQADLYYTQFALILGTLLGVRRKRSALSAFLGQHDPMSLDLPHLAALAQCQRLLHPLGVPRAVRSACLAALRRYRSDDGGFAETPGAERGAAYNLYLALLCHEALGVGISDVERARTTAETLLAAELSAPGPGISPLAAAALSLQALGGGAPADALGQALTASRSADGGFRAHPRAPLADLLSTAVASFLLRRLGMPLRAAAAAATAHFTQALWTAEGGFCASMADPLPDCEYTFYGVLALGALEP